jgi:DNA-binding transcriptional LysR family regulator
MRMGMTQPQVSVRLKELRALTGDPLLVRSGRGMAPTDAAMGWADSAARILDESDRIFRPSLKRSPFNPSKDKVAFRIAASDYMDPLFLPELVSQIKAQAPFVSLDLMPLNADFDYRRGLAQGHVDVVIGNWARPPGELHLGRLMTDDVVCLMSSKHPAVQRAFKNGWSAQDYLACEHIAPTPLQVDSKGVIDDYLAAHGMQRQISVRTANFGQIPLMVSKSLLVLTTGKQFCERYVPQLAVTIVPCPVPFPAMNYYQLWHDRTHASASLRWLREKVRDVAKHLTPRRA